MALISQSPYQVYCDTEGCRNNEGCGGRDDAHYEVISEIRSSGWEIEGEEYIEKFYCPGCKEQRQRMRDLKEDLEDED